jgi:hypothetical protein
VVDVGCGVGSWLAVFEGAGVGAVLGIEGEHLDKRYLKVDPDKILTANLSGPVQLPRRFDMALCLEVGGFIRSDRADHLIDTLTSAAPVVVFSAPIPFQDNIAVQPTQRWPDYWAELFARRDFVPLDCLRREIWHLDDIAFWYRQNTVLYVRREHLQHDERLRRAHEQYPGPPIPLVHPTLYLLAQHRLSRPWVHGANKLRARLGRSFLGGIRARVRRRISERAGGDVASDRDARPSAVDPISTR